MELEILPQFEMKIETKDKRSKGGWSENKTKTGSGQLRDFPWKARKHIRICLFLFRRRKKKGTSESPGRHLRCWEIGFSADPSLMQARPVIRTPDGKPEP